MICGQVGSWVWELEEACAAQYDPWQHVSLSLSLSLTPLMTRTGLQVLGSKKMPNFWELHIPPSSWEPKFQEMQLKLALEQLLQSTSQLFLGLESQFP